MSSRMEKYELDEKKYGSRAARNASLYQKENIEDYNKIDLNSNVSVLKTNAKDIDVDKIREMLDKKYRDNIPKRQSINIEIEDEIEPEEQKETTKEYDINEILAKAKDNKEVDYHEERLRNLKDTNYTILDNLNLKQKLENDDEEDDEDEATDEKELRELINTITQLEAKNKQKNETEKNDDLLDLTDENATAVLPPVETKENEEEPLVMENSFYTGNLAVNENDFDDFNDIEEEIKSNSIIIKLLIFIFIIIIFVVAVYFLNKYLNWGLF